MIVYRIVKVLSRTHDLSGLGAFRYGGRWNSKGVYMLYTSMNSSLAYLENMVHFNESDMPPDLHVVTIEIKDNRRLVYELPDDEYPDGWQLQGNHENRAIGDRWMSENKFIAFKVRSAVNPTEYNFLLNPLFPGFHGLVTVNSVEALRIDDRLIK